jgi:flagellar biosynthetic protein FliP
VKILKIKNKNEKKYFLLIVIAIVVFSSVVYAEPIDIGIPGVNLSIDNPDSPESTATTLMIILIITILSLAPSILIMMTSFTRIIIVLSITRNALGTQQMPPNQVLIGLALFLTLFVMSPVISEINENAYRPFVNNEILGEEAFKRAMEPLREFMFKQTYRSDLRLFMSLEEADIPEELDEISSSVLICSFITSEIKRAFQIGFLIFIPFIVIDMIVASTLMSMGMMMLPPIMISLPFKILLFVMVDGWHLVIKTLIAGFN